MKRNFILYCIVFFPLLGYSQESFKIKTRDFMGYIFKQDYFAFISIENQKMRYTPTKEDILHTEKLVRDNIDNYLKRDYQYKTHICKKTLKEYKRQYLGFVNENGDIIIWINFLKDKKNKDPKMNQDIIYILDGGENFWSIFVNITKRELFDIKINGIS